MEASVRYIATERAVVDGVDYSVGNKPALCFRGKSYALGIINADDQIKAVKLALPDHDKSPLVTYGVEEYPVGKFISHLNRMMDSKPISPEALRLILEWPNNPEDFGVASIQDPPVPPSVKKKLQHITNCIPGIAKELGTTPQKVRKFLRSQGLSAPYTDEKKIRQLMKKFNSGGKR